MAANETTLALRAILHDEISSALKNIQTEITQTGNKLGSSAPKATQLGTAMSGAASKTSELTQGLQGMMSKIPVANGLMSQFSGVLGALSNPMVALPALFAGAAVGVMKTTLAMADSIEHMRNLGLQTGLTINQIKGLKTVAAESGVSLDTVASSVGIMERKLGTNGAVLKQYGITAKDPINALAQASDLFNSIQDPMQRAKVMTELFGRSWQGLAPVLAQGGAEIKKANDSAGLSQDKIDAYLKLQSAVHKLGMEFGKLKNSVTSVFSAEVMTNIINDFIGLMHDATPVVQAFGYAMAGLAVVFDGALIAFRILGIGFNEVDDVIIGSIGAMIEWIGNALLKVIGAVGTIDALFGDLLPTKIHNGLNKGLSSMGNFASGMKDYGGTLKANAIADIDDTTNKLKALYAETDKKPETKKTGGKAPGGPAAGDDKIAGEITKQNQSLAAEKAYQDEYTAMVNAGIDTRIATIDASNEKEKLAIEDKYAKLIHDAGKNSKEVAELKRNEGAEIENLEKSNAAKIREVYADQAIQRVAQEGKTQKDLLKVHEDGEKALEEIQKQAASAQAEGLEGQAAIDAQRKAIQQESEMRKKDLQDKIKDDKTLQEALVANGKLTESKMAALDKKEMDDRKKNYEQYSQRVQTLAQGQLEAALKQEFTLKSAKEAVKNAAIQWIAEEATKRLATYIENLVFQKTTAATASAESIAQAEVTGTGIATAMATAAALQSVATMGGADVAGSAGLSSTIALAQGYAMAANGTDFAPGGTTLVGERGPEIVNLPKGSEVIPNHALKAWSGSSSNTTTTTHNTYVIKETINSRDLSKAISRAKSYQEISRGRGSI